MAESHLAPFAPGNAKNTILHLVARAFGIPVNNAPSVLDDFEQRTEQNRINSDILSGSAGAYPFLRPGDVRIPGSAKMTESYLNGFPDPNVHSRLRKSYFDEDSSKKRFGYQLRSPHVIYDTATNMVDRLEGGKNPAYYDEDTEQYIIGATQKRANPRYEYLLPHEAEKRQKEWESKNYRLGQNNKWNPLQILYGYNDAYTRNTIGNEQVIPVREKNIDRQKREDRLISQVAKLDYNNAYDDNWLYNWGREQMKPEELPGQAIQEFSDYGDRLMQRRLKIEKQPLDYFKKSKRVNEIKHDQGSGIFDAIEEVKRRAIQEYAKPYYQKIPANLAQKIIGQSIKNDDLRNAYDILYDAVTDLPVSKRAEENLRKYLFE